jgi:MFS family permease
MPEPVSDVQRRGMRRTMLAQTGGMLFLVAAKFGLLLLYLQALGIPGNRVLIYLSIPWLGFLLQIPLAPFADAYGRKLFGIIGQLIIFGGLGLLFSAGFVAGASSAEALAAIGISIYTVGNSMLAVGWFVFLMPLIPSDRRARFFGMMRLIWQGTGVVFVAIISAMLGSDPTVWAYQVVLLVVAAGALLRFVCVLGIPELEPPTGKRVPVLRSMLAVLRHPGYLPFIAYIFLLSLCVVPVPMLMGLVEKEGLGLGDNQIVFLGNITMVAGMIGLFLGGQVVDRFGSRLVFLVGHGLLALTLAVFIWRGALPWEAWWSLALSHAIYGFSNAAVGVAVTTELLSLIPDGNRSMATSIGSGMQMGGGALAGIVAAWLLALGLFAPSWQMGGAALTAYDALLLLFLLGIVVLVVCLGLVPNMLKPHQHLPQT